MPERENLITVCAEWVVKADNDLTNAAHTLKLRETCPTDTVCFHAQQCVEKYLKAILVHEGIDFPKTHDLETLVALVPVSLRPELGTRRGRPMAYHLRDRVIELLKCSRQPLKAREIAVRLELKGSLAEARKIVNQVLYSEIADLVMRDDKYRWQRSRSRTTSRTAA